MGMYNIGEILRGLRKSRGFSQKQLAEGTCTVEYISKIENGRKNPSQEIISRLFQRLGADPSLFFTTLSNAESEQYALHRFELERLLGESEFEKARAYIAELEKEYSFYASGEPKQYLMGKQSLILQNLDKEFDKARELAIRSILITKPEFTLDNMERYEFYSTTELWSVIYISTAYYWKDKRSNLADKAEIPIRLVSFVLRHLEKGYLHTSVIGGLYASSAFYLGRYLCMAGRLEESEEISMKGVSFITRHYNQILELLGKIIMNRALAMDMAKRKNTAVLKSGRRFPPFDQIEDEGQLYGFGEMLLLLAANEMTLHQYLDVPMTLFPHSETAGHRAGELPFSGCRGTLLGDCGADAART